MQFSETGMKILVGGGSGFIGKHLKRLLEKNGHEMLVVTRKANAPTDISWDELRRNGLPSGIDGIVNLAGTSIMSPVRWTEAFKADVLNSRVETTSLLSKVIRETENKPKSFISASAIGYYGCEDRGEAVSELSEPGTGFVADLCTRWEQSVDVSSTDVRPVIIRIGLALARDGGMFPSVYWPFFFGVGGILGNGKQWFPWIHALDVAGIILYSIQEPKVTGVLNAVAPQLSTNADFTYHLSRSMCRFAPFPVPGFILNTAFGEERGEMMLKSPQIVPKRTLDLGYQFVYEDLKAACQDCVTRGSY